ncbi:hypothetical protein GHYDROH2_23600 [Geobacter hydrogenophilus]|uniref:Uncharacterized protein n=1 Tax=Geobacter hydrogenophilus TaxID=40983 RepID=A0A9W6G1U2_9BACT|nr:hypothetical protein GHYDROH2_23600 [Geobacter hydrogenophilus]
MRSLWQVHCGVSVWGHIAMGAVFGKTLEFVWGALVFRWGEEGNAHGMSRIHNEFD